MLYSFFNDALDLPQEACLDIPRTREWEAAVAHYRTRFTAYGLPSQDVLLRLISRRLYIGPHVQAYLAGLDAEGKGRLTTRTLGVQRAMGAGSATPPFLTAVAAMFERTDPSLENDLSGRGPFEQRVAALGFTEGHQTTEGRDATLGALCIYYGCALENSAGDSEVGHLWATIARAHG